MSLSSDLISQFVKSTKDTTEKKTEATVYGTTVEYDGRIFVKLDGSDLLTPVNTTVDVKADEQVTVMIKDHTATITGNITSPAARTDDVKEIGTKVTEFEIIIADKVSVEQLEAEIARIDTLVSENITIKEKLTANEAVIETLQTTDAKITGRLDANDASIKNLESEKIDADIVEATYATIKSLDAANATIYNLQSTYGEFEELTTKNFEAVNADINNLETNKLNAEQAEVRFANIDFSNIGEAAIEKLFADSGIIRDLIMSEGKVTGELVGVTIKGDLIEANTLKAEKLVVKGKDGLYYKLNIDGGALTSDDVTVEDLQNGLSGSIIIAKSITAEKVAVDDLVAFDATIGGFHITNNSIYSGTKESVGNTTTGVYMDKDGQFAIGDSENFFRYFKDENGNYKLEVSAGSILFGTSHESVETAIQEIEADVTANTDAIEGVTSNIVEVSKELSTSIAQSEEGIISRVQSEFYNKDETDTLIDSIGTQLSQTENAWEMQFLGIAENISELSDATNTEFGVIKDYIRFEDGNIILGKTGNELKLNISNDRISFLQGSNEVAYMSNSKLYITDAEILASLRIGKFAFIPRSNGSLDFKKMG